MSPFPCLFQGPLCLLLGSPFSTKFSLTPASWNFLPSSASQLSTRCWEFSGWVSLTLSCRYSRANVLVCPLFLLPFLLLLFLFFPKLKLFFLGHLPPRCPWPRRKFCLHLGSRFFANGHHHRGHDCRSQAPPAEVTQTTAPPGLQAILSPPEKLIPRGLQLPACIGSRPGLRIVVRTTGRRVAN